MEDKIWTKEDIKCLLLTNDRAVIKALIAIHRYQTAEEQHVGESRETNSVGFSGPDAKLCTSLVDFYNERGFLSKKQMILARKKALKYTRQLKKIANGEYEVENIIQAL